MKSIFSLEIILTFSGISTSLISFYHISSQGAAVFSCVLFVAAMSRILTGQINRPVVKMPTFSFFYHEKAYVKKAINQKKVLI